MVIGLLALSGLAEGAKWVGPAWLDEPGNTEKWANLSRSSCHCKRAPSWSGYHVCLLTTLVPE